MSRVWPAFEIAANFYQATIMTFYVNKRCSLKNHSIGYDIALIICIGLTITGLDYIHVYLLDDIVFFLPLLFAVIFRKGRLADIIFWCILLGVIFSIDATFSSGIISTLTGAKWEQMLEKGNARLLYIIGANLLHTIIIVSICNIGRKNAGVSRGATVCFLLSLLVQFAAAECFFLIQIQASGNLSSALYGSIGLFISMILNIILYEIMIREADIRRELELESQTAQLIDAHQEELRTIYSNMLSTQHDLRHRIAAAEEILSQNDINKTHEAMELLKNTKVLNEFVTGNIGVDAVLVAKSAVMKAASIKFSYYLCPLSQLPIHEREFVVLLSNILDNAIEAVMKLPPASSPREIKLTLSRNWDIFSIVCENNMNPDTIHQQDGFFLSSKIHPELHGYGIRSIQRTVDDAGGLVEFSIDTNIFSVRIMLPMEE